MTVAEQLAAFAVQSDYEDLSEPVRKQVKTLVLDTLGCAIGSIAAEPIALIREQTEEFGGKPLCTLIGGGKTTRVTRSDTTWRSLRDGRWAYPA